MNDVSPIDLLRGTGRADNGLPPGADASPVAGQQARHLIDVRAIWSIVYRNRYLMISCLVVCVLLGLTITFLSTPLYRATAQVQIDMQEAKIIEGDDVSSNGQQDADRFLETQVDVLQSRSLARAVATQLGLFRDSSFLAGMNIKPAENTQGSFNLQQTQHEQVLNALQNNLKIKLPVDSSAVNVSFTSPDRSLSARIANGFADNYITNNLRRKFDTSAYARQFLENQLREVRQRLEESERALIDYARAAQLIDASSGQNGQQTGPSSLTTSSLIQLNQNLSQAIADRIKAEQHWREASATPLMNLAIVQQNPAISTLIQQRAQLRAQYQQNAQRYDSNYPGQRELQTQIDTMSTQITSLATDLRDGIRQEFVVAQKQESALQDQLSKFKNTTLAEQDRGVRYNILRREVDTNRTLYDGLLQRYKEISAAAGISVNNISIIDRADPPIGAVSPRPFLNLAVSIVAGLLVGSGFIFLRENFNDLIRSTSDVERVLGLPAVGVIPKFPESANSREEMADRKSDMSEAYAALRTKLLLSGPTGAPRSLIFTSSGPGEGKSTSALATASSFAQIGRRVVLIDADMRRPSQHKRFAVANKHGLSSILASQDTFDNVVIKTDQEGLDLVTAGPVPVNPAELIAGPGMATLIAQCARMYDVVIIDSPPVLGLADAPTLVASVSSTIFVVEANRVHARQVKDALARLTSINTHVLGILLTKFDAKSIGYYSSDYGYLYSYGKRSA